MISHWVGSTLAQDLTGNRTTKELVNISCDIIHATSYTLELVFVLALEKKKVMDKLTLS